MIEVDSARALIGSVGRSRRTWRGPNARGEVRRSLSEDRGEEVGKDPSRAAWTRPPSVDDEGDESNSRDLLVHARVGSYL
eukprot:scaffold9913_cov36-Cyclotella_meneghiniana.AAC.19